MVLIIHQTHPGLRVIHGFPARPITRHVAPKMERWCRVGWDRRLGVYRGMVQEAPNGTDARDPYWRTAPIIYDVLAPSIEDLAGLMRRYGAIPPHVWHGLERDSGRAAPRVPARPPEGGAAQGEEE